MLYSNYKINDSFHLTMILSFVGQGSVEGLAYEAIDNTLYWTCNNDATINKVNLSAAVLKPETIIKLGPSDKPRGIAVDSCDWSVADLNKQTISEWRLAC